MTDTERPTFESRRKFLVGTGALGAAALAGCIGENGGGSGGSDTETEEGGSGLSGDVTVTGSSTVYPVSVAMAEEFEKENEEVDISVDSTGSGGGFENHFCPGNSDINGASRPITEEEEENCGENDVDPREFQIASDALTVVVNTESDIESITFDELAQIWEPDGAETWSDVRDDWPDEKLELYGPASTSGTFDWFTENVVGEAGSHRDDYEPTEDDNKIIEGVEGSENAMGYLGYSYYQENSDRVKAVNVAEEDVSNAVKPNLENAKSGDYPMARPLFIYPAAESIQEKDQVYEFLKYYIEQSETDIVSEIGYVPANADLRDQNLDELDEIRNE
ncbi:PstS family phosphate ABC transporter substrate-binding protein [Halorussus salilacus]|uniref:PstS family phosphate ABC transporter substrate-binding protein n=1 Tax=Halorussus salilacus TaxID=2953750 RepID=UPI0020A038F5|nr:PstS family phosphate ABC transporter substrate-binding protein [Halorussus salilacus]USZ67666.1 PstS family phosphate ABC transporter substrate-binding protein [Halorussus salilacus]